MDQAPGNQKHRGSNVVFQSQAKYSTLVVLLLLFVPVFVIAQLLWILTHDVPDKRQALTALFRTFFSLCIVFALVMPIRYEVLPDRSVNVVTVFRMKWNFSKVREARRLKSLCDEWQRPKWKFATAMESNYRVAVHRDGGWDLLVSPTEADEFIRVINANDHQGDEENELL